MGKSSAKSKRRNAQISVTVNARAPKDRLPAIRKIELLWALALTGVIVSLHVYRASQAGPLWRDEVATISAATMPSLSQLWSSLVYESYPILPYLVVRMWTGFNWLGGGDTSLRILGALIGTGIVFVLWFNRQALRYNVPICSLVLFGLNPLVIPWGDSIRGYGLGMLFLLLAYGLVWKVVELPTRGRVLFAASVSVLSVQCLYQNAFLLLAICLGGSLVCVRKRLWKRALLVLGIGMIPALSLLPYLPTIRAAQEVLLVAQSSYAWSSLFQLFAWSLSSNVTSLLWTWFLCCGICILFAGYIITVKSKDREYEHRVDLCLFSLTILIIGSVSFLLFMKSTNLPTNPWYYIVLMSSIAVSVDVGIEQLASTFRRRVVRLVLALLVAGVTFPITWKILPERNTNLDRIASMLEERASEEDFIVVSPYWYGITFQRYYQGKTDWITIPPMEDLELNRYDLLKEKMSAENPMQPVWDGIEKSLRSGNRIWVIGAVRLPPEGQLPKTLTPAPNGPAGWEMGPYLGSWQEQLGYFLNSHLLENEEVPLQITDRIRINPGLEAPIVQAGKGWR